MSVTKNAIVSAVSRATGSDKDDVRLHVDMFLAGVGQELSRAKSVRIKHFGTLRVSDAGEVVFDASPSLVRVLNVDGVVMGIAEEVAEALQARLPGREVIAQP